MPRIRTIKPELWTSEDFRSLSAIGRLAFIALISQADDHGRLKMTAKHLADVFVAGARVSAVAAQLELMQSLSMVRIYSVDGCQYMVLENWSRHQKVDHPQASRIPEPPEIRESSRTFANPREPSRTFAASRAPADRIGSDRRGSSTSSNAGTPTREAQAILEACQKLGGRQPSPKDLLDAEGLVTEFQVPTAEQFTAAMETAAEWRQANGHQAIRSVMGWREILRRTNDLLRDQDQKPRIARNGELSPYLTQPVAAVADAEQPNALANPREPSRTFEEDPDD